MLEALKRAIPQPAEMKDESYNRTLKARAFDVARYMLPLATNTSLGQIVNARTLEMQVSRLLTSEFAEVRSLAEKLRKAATEPAWSVTQGDVEVLVEEICSVDDECGIRARAVLNRAVPTAPTLVKYAAPNVYLAESRKELAAAAAELMDGQAIEPAPVVDLIEDAELLEIELATSLLYPHCHYGYRQLRSNVAALDAAKIDELIALGTKHRGRHDELLRSFSAGQSFRFDILMDIGGFRDMHRHRRCIQLLQGYTDAHGYDEPTCPGQPTLAEVGLEAEYNAAMDAAFAAYRSLRDSGASDAAQSAQYLLPLGTRCRAMFKMDFAEALYISELRSGIAGHFSYRRVAWEMYKAVEARHPGLAKHFRIEDVNVPVDLLKR
jgi:thymidylate synthase ThyX